jgi:hypothetical protein
MLNFSETQFIDLNKTDLQLIQVKEQTQEITAVMEPIKPIMEQVVITSSTWDRECHGLYDFDLSGIETIQSRFVGCGYV